MITACLGTVAEGRQKENCIFTKWEQILWSFQRTLGLENLGSCGNVLQVRVGRTQGRREGGRPTREEQAGKGGLSVY